jgi:RNA polymerase sigma factor (sigma-70 family)
MGHLDCRRLLDRCIETNDEAAWEELLERLRSRLLSGVRKALARIRADHDSERTEDLLQEAYCHLLDRDRWALRACRGRSEGEIAAYLMRVAENVAFDELRREAAAKRGGNALCHADGGAVERVPSPGPEPEERLHLRRLRQQFQRSCRIVCRDSARNRRIVEAAFLQGWTSPEIVRHLASDLKVASVDSLLSRLRRRFSEYGIDLPPRFNGRPGGDLAPLP